MFRVEDLLKVPDFESRANEFIKKIERLAGIFPNVYAVARNKTLNDLESGPGNIAWMDKEYPEFAKAERQRDRENEIESSYMNVVGIQVGSEYRKELAEFIRTVDGIAKEMMARKQQSKRISDHGIDSGYTFRYEGELWYDFD